MKRMILHISSVLFCISLLFCSCNLNPYEGRESASAAGTTASPVSAPATPSDEEKIFRTESVTDDDGVTLSITVHGYRSKSRNMDFYAKSNEYFHIDVSVTNGSADPVYYFLPRYCNEDVLPHNHEVGFDLSCGEYDLHSSSSGFIIARTSAETEHVRALEPGKTHAWQLKLAAGEISADQFDLPADGKAYSSGIKLYGPEIYTDGICTFEGSVFFGYSKSEVSLPRTVHDLLLSVPLSVDFVYVSPRPSA